MSEPRWRRRWDDRIVSAGEAVAVVRPGQRVFVGSGAGEPQTLVEALSGRNDLSDTEIVLILTLGVATYAEPRFGNRLRHNAYFIGPNVRQAVKPAAATRTTWSASSEYGAAYLHGKTIRERAMALIGIADPKFRPWVMAEAKTRHLVYADQIELPIRPATYPEELERWIDLDDGARAFLRPLKLSDEPLLKALFYKLSPESVHYRLFQLIKSMPHERLQEFLRIDYEADMAFVVLTGAADESAEMIGIAHYLHSARTKHRRRRLPGARRLAGQGHRHPAYGGAGRGGAAPGHRRLHRRRPGRQRGDAADLPQERLPGGEAARAGRLTPRDSLPRRAPAAPLGARAPDSGGRLAAWGVSVQYSSLHNLTGIRAMHPGRRHRSEEGGSDEA